MTIEEVDLQVLQGRVKWFDSSKGFGFIVVDGIQSDILLHANVLRNFGQGSVADGSGICVKVQMTARGTQAVEVVSIDSSVTTVTIAELTGEGVEIDLRNSGFADLQAGEAVCLKITDGQRGRMAVQVLPWDVSTRDSVR